MNKRKKLSILAVVLIAFTFFAFLPVSGQIKFVYSTKEAGLHEPLRGMIGHCAAWGDVNGDGFPDLYYGTFAGWVGGEGIAYGYGTSPNKLFLNKGDGTFEEVMDSPVRVIGWNSGAAFADFDNDGDLDLVVSHQAHKDSPHGKVNNFLFANDGTGKLTDVTKESGLSFETPFLGRNTFVFDYDGDGLLDIFMQEDYALAREAGGNSRLIKNMGDLKFRDVTAEANFPTGRKKGLYGLGGVVGDINGDTWPDVFFAHSCRMFINNHDGTFHEQILSLVDKKITEPATTNPNWTCGADIGDIDNDGDMDLVMGDHFHHDSVFHRMYVYLNDGNDSNGDPILRDITYEAGLVNPDGRTFHTQIQDMDNDGLMDIITSRCNSIVYRNSGIANGIPHFEKPVNTGMKGGIGYWAGGALGDYNRDGKLDFMGPEWNTSYPSVLLRNETPGADNYIEIKPELLNSANRNAIGARVEIFREGKLGKKKDLLGTCIISVSNGYSCGYEAIAHFGVPNDKKVDVMITMPCNGKIYNLTSVARNQRFIVKGNEK